MELASIKVGLAPIALPNARLFVLGSLPGDASLGARQYYAHRTNQFWRLLGGAIAEPLQELPYAERLDRLARRGVGLWDVIASAERRGSLDQAIRLAEHNRIVQLLSDFPNLRAIAFNGATAARAGRKLIGDAPPGIALVDLPSSSAANTARFEEKARAWAVLAQFVAT
ncbi:DNA-deoxyinosine glycosylase [Sphingomonas sp.]|uniref:DNA-deoxyinosine glycosylase n=1 Tax=Sphingomonas sp. TaxID=28214 RepID=UPI0025E5560F|nr:DNA-deoxyinosine glycosylase [Sphingomonas sp.]